MTVLVRKVPIAAILCFLSSASLSIVLALHVHAFFNFGHPKTFYNYVFISLFVLTVLICLHCISTRQRNAQKGVAIAAVLLMFLGLSMVARDTRQFYIHRVHWDVLERQGTPYLEFRFEACPQYKFFGDVSNEILRVLEKQEGETIDLVLGRMLFFNIHVGWTLLGVSGREFDPDPITMVQFPQFPADCLAIPSMQVDRERAIRVLNSASLVNSLGY